MTDRRWSYWNSKGKAVSLFVSFALMFSLFSPLYVRTAAAEASRVAHIDQVSGIAYIQKAGGSKELRAFDNMTLQQGDRLRTEANSSITFTVSDRGDVITIGERSELYISDLREKLGSKNTKFFIWSGSIWATVATLTHADDAFEIETPAAKMDVRGTTLLVGVNPETGESRFFIASGRGQVVKTGGDGETQPTTLNPSEQLTIDEVTSSEDFDDYRNIVDIDDLIANTSSAIIEAIIASKAAIDQENDQYIANLQQDQGTSDGTNQEAIARINQNLQNLVGNIVNNAIKQNKVDEELIKLLIDRINEQLDNKLDLDHVKALELSEQEKQKQAKIKQLEEERRKKQEEENRKQEELKKQNEALQKKLKEQLDKQKEAKQKAEEVARNKAEEEYKKRLEDDAARQAFEAKQKAMEAERERQEAAARSAVGNTGDPSSSPTPAPTPAPKPQPTPEDRTPPTLVIIEPAEVVYSNTGELQIVLRTEQNVTVTVSVYDGTSILAMGTGRGLDKNATLTITNLAEGAHDFLVVAIDAAGNTTTISLPTFTVDTIAPEIYQVIPFADGMLGSKVWAEKDSTIQLFEGEVLIVSGIGLGEDHEVILSWESLPAGTHYLTLKVYDAAHNVSESDPFEVYIPYP